MWTKTSLKNHALKLLRSFNLLCASHVVLQGCDDFSFIPIFNGAACGVDWFIGPFHKLILVVALGTFVSNELVSCAAGCIVDGLFLGEFWLNYPMPNLHATHEVKHILHSQQSHPEVPPMVPPVCYTSACLCAHVHWQLVLVHVDVLDGVDVLCIWVSILRLLVGMMMSRIRKGTGNSLFKPKGGGKFL